MGETESGRDRLLGQKHRWGRKLTRYHHRSVFKPFTIPHLRYSVAITRKLAGVAPARAHTHAHTVRTYAHTYMQREIETYTHTHTHTHTHIHTHIHTHSRTNPAH